MSISAMLRFAYHDALGHPHIYVWCGPQAHQVRLKQFAHQVRLSRNAVDAHESATILYVALAVSNIRNEDVRLQVFRTYMRVLSWHERWGTHY